MSHRSFFDVIREEIRKSNHAKARQLLNEFTSRNVPLTTDEKIKLALIEIELSSYHYEINQAFQKALKLQVQLFKKRLVSSNYYLELSLLVLDILDRRGLIDAMMTWYFQAEEVFTTVLDDHLPEKIAYQTRLLFFKAILKMHKGKFDMALSLLKKIEMLGVFLGDDYIKGRALILTAIILRDTKRLDEARIFFENALEIANSLDNQAMIAVCYNGLGSIEDLKGDLDSALEKYEIGLRIAEKIKDPFILGNFYNNIAIILRLRGDPEGAMNYYEKSLKNFEKTQNPRLLGMVHHNMAVNYWDLKSFFNATVHEEKSIEYKKLVGNPVELSISYSTLGIIQGIQGKLDLALKYFMKALDNIKHVKDHEYLSAVLNNIGYAYYSKGELDKALSYFEQTNQLMKKTGNPFDLGENLLNIGLCYLRMGQVSDAQEHLQESKKLFLSVGQDVKAADPSFNLLILFLETFKRSLAKQELTFLRKVRKKHPKREYLNQLYAVGRAAYLKSTALSELGEKDLKKLGLALNKIGIAEELLECVLNGPLTDYELKVLAYLHVTEISLLKARTFEEHSFLEKADHAITKILELSEEQHSQVLKVQALWLKQKLALVKGETEKARNLVTEAINIAHRLGLGRMEKILRDEWKHMKTVAVELKTSRLPISIRLGMTKISESLWCLQNRRLFCEKPSTIPVTINQAAKFLELLHHRFGTARE